VQRQQKKINFFSKPGWFANDPNTTWIECMLL